MILSYHWLCSLLGTDPGLDRVVERLNRNPVPADMFVPEIY